MPLANPIQASLSGGEISPSLYSRTDIDKYRSSARTVRNFILHPHGGASNRPGTKFIYQANSADTVVLHEFIFSRTQVYVLEFGETYVRFYTDGAIITDGGSPYEVATPYLAEHLQDLKFESSADVIYITHPSYAPRTLTRYGNADWELATYSPTDGPFMAENDDDSATLTASAVTGSNITLTSSSVVSYDTTITALMHFDGTNGSTTMTEETGKLAYANVNAQIATAQSVFGGSSLALDGASSVSLPYSSAWYFAGNFTITARIRLTASGNFEICNTGTGAGVYWRFFYDNSAGKLKFTYENGGTQILANQTWSPSLNTWYEVRVVRSGNNFHLFVNGTLLGTDVDADSMTVSNAALYIGAFGSSYATGYIDELCIFNGTATHTSGYTVPTTAYAYATTSANFLFSPQHVGALFKLRHYIESQSVAGSLGSATASSSIKCFTTWRLITHGTWTGTLRVEKSTDGGTTWTVLRSFSSVNDFNPDTFGTEDIETNETPFLVRVNMSSYTSGTCTYNLTSDPFYQDGVVQVTSFNSNTSVQAEVLTELGSTSGTVSWFEGAWSDYRGYPTVSRFFQDRLCMASTPTQPQTIWMSRTGNYTSHKSQMSPLDTDAIAIDLPSRQLNAISGLVPFKKLLAFTSSSVWSIGPTDTNALTPTTVSTDVEEYAGASYLTPSVVGGQVIYPEFGDEIVRIIGYQLQSDSFEGTEMNILSRHLLEGYSIRKMVYQRKPNGIIWIVRSDGQLLSLTYQKEQEVVAWAHHDTADDEVLSACVIPTTSGDDELWLTVSRTNGVFVESMKGRRQHNFSGLVFMDSYVDYTSPTTVLSSLTHLANEIVGVVGDSSYLGTQTVAAGGTLGLSSSYTSVQVGKLITADIETLDIDIPMGPRTMQGMALKVGNVAFRLLNTRGGYIGPDSDNLYEAFDYAELNNANLRENGAALGATANFSGIVRVPLGGGAETAGRVFYRQKEPYPVTILAIIPEIQVGDSVT